jgi:hypothetical protein
MKRELSILVIAALGVLAVAAPAAAEFQVTSVMQAELDRLKTIIAGWAADPILVKAVVEQNSQGPLEGMDNAKWKVMRRSDPVVKAFQNNATGRFLRAKLEASGGLVTEAFLSAARGEKVAFVEKTTWYVHKGMSKFDVPFTTKKPWQGRPEFDESAQTYQIQLAVPVLSEGQAIGALVVGVSLTTLERLAKK